MPENKAVKILLENMITKSGFICVAVIFVRGIGESLTPNTFHLIRICDLVIGAAVATLSVSYVAVLIFWTW